ncbi:AIPR family protein [Chryseobacterium cucumeris]|uniref:AIPR family protein n=1 Tax=Chryseobacterium cucumeris TaxID=1813611 RepID=UPI00192D81A6|nr:AIPR family protein [Chryseobacterium cucumeris]QRA43518.1 AIPR family protein [Chryseobacterium cucumeris]
MQVEPIINARFKQFRQKNELENVQDGIAFEKFVNYTIFTLHHPDAFSADTESLEFVSVGGASDMGIDGLAIKVEDIIVKTKNEIDDIIKFNRNKRINVEFIFIQSKYKTHFDKGELNNFVDGVRDFLSDEHHFPMNDNIRDCLELKEYLLSDEITIMWDNNPNIILYYVGMGRWKNPADLVGIANQFGKDISHLNIYNFESNNFKFIDSNELKNIYDSIQNTFSATIDTRHSMPLTDVNDVSNSCLSIVYGSELIKLISTDDGIIRKSLFNDNVRDFQGLNPVNLEIENTVKDSPEKFIILNNGITIVCDEYKQNNTKLTIFNPQIVNGCQTSHIIYECYKKNLDLSKVPISIRVISTTDEEIVNDIVRGTNRQNIVLEEAFESTKKFHKDLEEFFTVVSPEYETIYYERRSKQYQHNPIIKQTQKVNLRILTQYYLGVFLNKPHISHRHESILLKENKDDIFQDYHSKLPYFTLAYLFIKFENFLRQNTVPRIVRTYKSHILMMLRQTVMGYLPSQNKETEVDKSCNKLLIVLKDNQQFEKLVNDSIKLFTDSLEKWETVLGKSRRGTKDVEAFTLHLINEVNSLIKGGEKSIQLQDQNIINSSEKVYLGKIIAVIRDKYGDYYGFIEKNPNNIFVHSKDNKNFTFNNLKGRKVMYKIIYDEKSKLDNTKEKAVIEKIV